MIASSSAAGTAARHVVVIATIGRPQIERALYSVRAQSHPPERVLVVVDGRPRRKNIVEQRVKSTPLRVDVFRNDRTRGASGAWNTALDQLARAEDRAAVVVSFLDDDDWWEPDHLAVIDAAVARGAEVIATTIVRHDAAAPEGAVIEPPAALVHADFLRGNPGIQGSNLSAKLSTLLHAGLFDEALRSCTDRDLCIRLADLGVRYEAVSGGRAHHEARRRGRLSTPGSAAKQQGLDTFHAKHAWRMAPADERAFLERGRAFFAWTPSPPPPVGAVEPRVAQTTEAMEWIVAAIVDSADDERARPFLAGLARLAAHPRVVDLTAVLLQNGPTEGFARIVSHARACGLRVEAVDDPACRRIGGGLGCRDDELGGKKSIAVARSVLQQATHRVARARSRPVVWIADDDVRLPSDVEVFVDDVARARAAGLDVAIGMVAGAPPVPAATTLRTQLVDLVSFLRGATVRRPGDAMPDAEVHNSRWRHERRDYYYDLVRRQTDRLETPFLPITRAAYVGAAVSELVSRVPRILAGEQVFRPVRPIDGDPIALAQESTLRGGNTFVFDVGLLRDVPNLSPRIDGRRLRRSDMLWAVLVRSARGREVRVLPIFVEHDRSREEVQGLDPEKLFDDILGYAFARAFEQQCRFRGGQRASPAVHLDGKARDEIMKQTRKFVRERLAELRLSCARIRGLAQAIDHLLDAGPQPAGLDDDGAATLRRLSATLRHEFAEAAFTALEARATGVLDDPGFGTYLDAIETNERVVAARWCCEARLGRVVDEVLGWGGEGVIFRVGDRAVKVFDRWTDQERRDHLPALHALAARPAVGALPAVLVVHDADAPVVVETEWEPSEPYAGGRGADILALIRSLRVAGWSHTNVHPKNLRVMRHGVQLIDVGRSLAPFSEEVEVHVARRALLSMRGAGREDLDDLLRASIHDGTLPELRGVELLLAAARGDDPKARLDDAIARITRSYAPARVLDYGGGKPRPFRTQLGAASFAVFDPDTTLAPRWASEAPDTVFIDEAALFGLLGAGPRFNAVLCSLVLCTLDDDAALNVLARIRSLLSDDGVAVVAVCDPRSLHVERTARHHRFLPQGARYNGSFSYVKKVLGHGARVEHHRPVSAYRRALSDAGLEVVAEHTITGVDTERFVAAPEFLAFELRVRSTTSRRATDNLAGLTVLSYHRIASDRPEDPALRLHRARGMVVSPMAFAAQMRALGRSFVPVRAEDVAAAALGRAALPHRAVWITFDDGYRDILANVLPVLERERLPATFFARAPGEGAFPSWAPLDLCYQVLGRVTSVAPTTLLPFGEARERLLSSTYGDQIRWVLALAAQHGVEVGALRREDVYLSGGECAELVSRGFTVGAHGTDHVRWTMLGEADLEQAVRRSADWLDGLAVTTPYVAYPDAALDRRVADVAQRMGFFVGVVLEQAAGDGIAPRLAVQRRVARDHEHWIESLASELEGV
jgi:peptidoglycan/xylan/chitin deacetylase (PgdA/CDA1 family)